MILTPYISLLYNKKLEIYQDIPFSYSRSEKQIVDSHLNDPAEAAPTRIQNPCSEQQQERYYNFIIEIIVLQPWKIAVHYTGVFIYIQTAKFLTPRLIHI